MRLHAVAGRGFGNVQEKRDTPVKVGQQVKHKFYMYDWQAEIECNHPFNGSPPKHCGLLELPACT
jgi:hypothetical protein